MIGKYVELYKKHTSNDLLKDCSEFFDEVGFKVLYRGFRRQLNSNTEYMEFFGKTNRNPKNSSIQYHNFLNSLIEKDKKTANRNDIFVSGDDEEAEGYGQLYVCFPKNGFKYTWSPYLKDAYSSKSTAKLNSLWKLKNSEVYRQYIKKNLSDAGFLRNQDEEYYKELLLRKNKIFWGDDLSLYRAIASKNEIMIRGTLICFRSNWFLRGLNK